MRAEVRAKEMAEMQASLEARATEEARGAALRQWKKMPEKTLALSRKARSIISLSRSPSRHEQDLGGGAGGRFESAKLILP